MNENRRKILDMLAAGQITADEAERLMTALEKEPAASGATNDAAVPKPKPKYIHVLVEDNGHGKNPKVNVRVPMQLLRAGVKLADMDLIGIPHRVVLGERGLAAGKAEDNARADEKGRDVPLADAVAMLVAKLR